MLSDEWQAKRTELCVHDSIMHSHSTKQAGTWRACCNCSFQFVCTHSAVIETQNFDGLFSYSLLSHKYTHGFLQVQQ